jgi:hypothetical protein
MPLAADAILDVFREWDRVNLDSSLVTGIGQDQNMYSVREKNLIIMNTQDFITKEPRYTL